MGGPWSKRPASETRNEPEECGKTIRKGGFIATGPVKGHYADTLCTKPAGHGGGCS